MLPVAFLGHDMGLYVFWGYGIKEGTFNVIKKPRGWRFVKWKIGNVITVRLNLRQIGAGPSIALGRNARRRRVRRGFGRRR